MFKLIKGDLDNLEGKVLVYAKNLSTSEYGPEYPALFSSADIIDILNFQGYTDSAEIKKRCKKIKSDIEKKKQDSGLSHPIVSICADIASPEDAKKAKTDVIYAGNIPDISFAIPVLVGVSNTYMANYFSQKKKTKESMDLPFYGSFAEYADDEVVPMLYTFAGELMDSINYNDVSRQKKAIESFRRFAKGSKFQHQVNNVIGVAQTDLPEKQDMMDRYLTQISAILSEDFEIAHQIQIELDQKLRD